MKITATEWYLRRIVKNFGNNEDVSILYEIAKIELIIPVTNVWEYRVWSISIQQFQNLSWAFA